jgi:hypothetical protein
MLYKLAKHLNHDATFSTKKTLTSIAITDGKAKLYIRWTRDHRYSIHLVLLMIRVNQPNVKFTASDYSFGILDLRLLITPLVS